jgi:hypothetical protein
VSRAGLIWNYKSHRNLGSGRAHLPADVLHVVPEEPSELAGALRRFAAEGVDLVVVDGGDGTVREVVSRLPEAYGGKIPRIAVLPNGKTNALALDIETPLGTSLEQILVAAKAGKPLKRRQCLEIVRPGQPTAERRGFIFGMGAFVRATELAQKSHGVGFFDDAAVAVTIAATVGRTLLSGPNDPWRRGEAAQLSFATPSQRTWFLLAASTLKRLPLGVKPFGEPREGLKVLSIEAPPRKLIRALRSLIRGDDAAWLAANGYRRDDMTAFDLTLPGHFVLDGEIYEGGDLTVRQGPELEFVIP